MNRTASARALAALLSLLPLLPALAGCAAAGGGDGSRGAIEITSPESGALLARGAVTVEGTTSLATDALLVGGETVAVEGGRFEVTLDLVDGPHRITASAEGASAAVDVFVDATPPLVVVESPALGSFVDGDEIRVAGRVEDATFQDFYIGERSYALGEDGRFDVLVPAAPGAHRFRIRAVDQAGHEGYGHVAVIAGRFAPPGREAPEGIAYTLGADALRVMGDGIAPALDSERFRSLLMAANPVADAWWGELHLLGETHSMTQVGLTPREGALEAVIVLYDVSVPFMVDLAVGPTLRGTTYVDAATAFASIRIDAASGLPVVEIDRVDVTLSGLFIDVDGLWDWVDRNVVTRAVQGTLQTKLEEMVMATVPPVIDGMLTEMPTSHALRFLGSEVRIGGSFDRLAVSRRGIEGSVALSVENLTPDRAVTGGAPGTLVMYDGTVPDTTHESLGAALSLDVLNAALYAAWSTGSLRLRKDQPVLESTGQPLTFAGLVLLIPSLRGRFPDDAPVSFIASPKLPIVVQRSDSGLVELVAPDLRTEVVVVVDGEDQRLFELSIGVHAAVDVRLRADEVAFSIVDYGMQVDPVRQDEVPRGAPLGPALDALLLALAEPVVEPFLEVGGLVIPSFGGFSVSAPRAVLEGSHLVFEGTLVRER